MQILVNGEPREIAGRTLAELLARARLRRAPSVATAVNGTFVPAGAARRPASCARRDRVEVLAPRQGG